MTTKITIDFETRSQVSLPKLGAWMYSIHPSTEPITLSWSDDFTQGWWDRGDDPPAELFRMLADPDMIVEAHSSFFEWCIWHNICMPRYGWPEIPWKHWRCSKSKAAACSIPKSLGAAGRSLYLKVVKDEAEGKRAMMKLSKPKKDGTWHEDAKDFADMKAYNLNDVISEEHLSDALPDLSKTELEVWRMTEEINRRGVMVDVVGCRRAVEMSGQYARLLTDEFSKLTGLETAGQRAKFLVWLAGRGHQLDNTQAETLDHFIKHTADDEAKRAAGIVREIGRSSIKKYRACLDSAAPDGRARGGIQYHAAHTGRWSGQLYQPQNFKRECPHNMDNAWDSIHKFDLDTLEFIYGNPLKFFGDVTRGALVAAPGKVLMAGDWAQIEPRVLFWQANERRGLASFKRGEDVYLEMASLIFNKRLNKKDHPEERFLGKHAVLALGYGAGYIKFLIHCRDLGAPKFGKERVKQLVPRDQLEIILEWITDPKNWAKVKKKMPDVVDEDVWDLALCKHIVNKYRARHKTTVYQYWFDVEDAARRAIAEPGISQKVGKVSFRCGEKNVFHDGKWLSKFLNCTLPSGRIMRYLYPDLHFGKNKYRNGEGDDEETDERYSLKGEITYMTPDEHRIGTYGGKLVENLTQAISRDIMAERMLELRKRKEYQNIVLTIHDEVISEVDEGVGSLQEFLDILAVVPDWCSSVPIKVEGWQSGRYHKE